MIAKIAVSNAVYAMDKPYDYRVSPRMELLPGMRVKVPFGRGNRMVEGMVLAVEDGEDERLKTVAECLDESPVMSDRMLRLAAFLRERYFCTFYDAIKAILPAGLWLTAKERYELTELPPDWRDIVRRKEHAAELIDAIVSLGGKAEEAAIARVFPDREQRQELLRYLLGKKLLRCDAELLHKNADRTEKLVELSASAEEAIRYAAQKKRSAPMQAAVLELLAVVGAVSAKELCYFTGATMQTLTRLEKLGYLQITRQEILRRSRIEPYRGDTSFPLNPAQKTAFDALLARMQQEKPGVSLLYGVTGSGKTAVYINLIRACLAQGRSAILLVPEIALTPQLLSLFSACFGERIAVLHSSLRVGERYDEWKRIRRGDATVVLGTRSAVFAPAQNVGLLILDEEQEHTYKSENTPRYSAREVAIYRGARERALTLLGSATPSVESMFRAKEGVYDLQELPERFNGKALPEVTMVDMKQEIRNGNGTAISAALADAIRDRIARKEKAILLLNRRGASRLTVCIDCGYVAACPRCSVNLTYHTANHRLMCHYCGYSEPAHAVCPACGGHIKQIGYGTQRVQQELQTLFPAVEILRMDADTVSPTNPHEKILSRFANEDIPVLIGTQMVAKGLNFEAVTLVGVIDADMSLYVDHFRAAETTFSLLTQVVGRAGRGDKPGTALIQTMTPQNRVLLLAAQQDYNAFYEQEIVLRQARNCPPFYDLIQIGFTGYPERQVIEAAAAFRDRLQRMLAAAPYVDLKMLVLGPAPASVAKMNNRYRYRLSLNCENSKQVRTLLSWLIRAFSNDRKNRDVTVFADVNPYE